MPYRRSCLPTANPCSTQLEYLYPTLTGHIEPDEVRAQPFRYGSGLRLGDEHTVDRSAGTAHCGSESASEQKLLLQFSDFGNETFCCWGKVVVKSPGERAEITRPPGCDRTRGGAARPF